MENKPKGRKQQESLIMKKRKPTIRYTTVNAIKGKHGGIKNVQIPKEKFEKALELANSKNRYTCAEYESKRSCFNPIENIHEHKFDMRFSQQLRLLSEARNYLVRRDWKSLAKILIIAKPLGRGDAAYYSHIFIKYATICLAHNPDADLMRAFMESVINAKEEDKQNYFMTKLCSL